MAIKSSLYDQFREWFKQKYGWLQSLGIPSNTDELMSNPYFFSFLDENKLWTAAPNARRNYEQQFAQPTLNAQPAMVNQPSTQWATEPWIQRGLSQKEFADKYPDQYQAYQAEINAQKLNLTSLQYRQFIQGMPESIWNPQPEGMTPYQQEQVKAQRAQLGIEQANQMNLQRQNELLNRSNLLGQETQRLSTFSTGTNTAPYGMRQQQLADQWEQMRQLAASSNSPRNWVQQSYAAAGQGEFKNPYVTEPVDWAEESKRVKGEVQVYKTAENQAKAKWQSLAARVADEIPDNNPSAAELEAAAYRYNELKSRRQGAEMNLVQRTEEESKGIVDWSKPRPADNGGFEEGGKGPSPGSAKSKPYTVNVPAGIKPFLQSPTFGSAMVRPSGQQFASMTPTTLQQLYGYMEAMGQNPEDLWPSVQRELPKNPSLGRRMTPASQWA